ncbi:MAG: metallophosphoesterase [Chitinophagales bacterium]
MKTVTIAQITDIHIGMQGEDTNGIDVRANFLCVLKEVEQAGVDYIVVSGDLCFDIGIREIYEWVKSALDAVGIPYFVIPGNHDNPSMLALVFGLEHLLQKEELFYQREIEEVGKLLFLDSTTGIVSAQQLTFLKESCQDPAIPNLLFVHHPPSLADITHMDNNYALKNIGEVQAAIGECASKPHAIFCGHYHCGRTIVLPKLHTNVFITPSSAFFQLNPDAVGFEIKSERSAWRKIVWDGESVKTSVCYVGNYAKNLELVRQYYKAWETGDKMLLPLAKNLKHISPDVVYHSRNTFLKACWDKFSRHTWNHKMLAMGNRVSVLMKVPYPDNKVKLISEWFEIEGNEITKIQVIY